MDGFQPRREVLDNGIVLLWSEKRDSSAVAVRGSFPAGAARESPGREGLAGFAARLLRRGTLKRSAQELALAVEDVGASFQVWAGTEEAGFSAKCLARDLERVLDVLKEVLQAPSFDEREIEKTRGEILTQLREQAHSTRAVAELSVLGRLYPAGHPYARSSLGDRESSGSVGRAELRGFHDLYYSAPGMVVSVAGSVEPDVIRSHLGRWFSGRAPAASMPDWRVVPEGEPGRVSFSMPHKSQVDIILGGPGVPREHPDFYALSLVTMILGSLGLMGRLGESVRDRLGLAYSVHARSVSRLWAGEWIASAGVGPLQVEPALEAILAEIRRMREEPVTDQELEDARDHLIGSLPIRMETSDGIAAYLLNGEYYGLGLDYIDRYPGYLRAETRETLRAAFRRHVDPDRLCIAMAGPL